MFNQVAKRVKTKYLIYKCCMDIAAAQKLDFKRLVRWKALLNNNKEQLSKKY